MEVALYNHKNGFLHFISYKCLKNAQAGGRAISSFKCNATAADGILTI
jgi:hypothetical protein